ncbi:DNA replication and repair protein RecF [TM7 phylum sp. oral taxon 348]|nr:DNA replication and repair protein RecF [TM7 phylum sp. oral taxon 348]TWP28600.1 DNA replication and repair protein RecF [TM7 phylum sp. oral taxon 348]
MSHFLRLQNFRCHQDYQVELPSELTIITGPNGSGKTSLIEATYLTYQGKSWRSNFDQIRRQTGHQLSDWWRVDLTDQTKETTRTIKYQSGQKSFTINDRTYYRLPQTTKVPVILFEPGDMQLLYGSPTRRRQFIDRFIAQLEPTHQRELNKFNRVLKQRNILLKQDDYSAEELMIWDIQFSDLSSTISQRRRQYLQDISEMLSAEYQQIAGSNQMVQLRFSPGAPMTSQAIMHRLTGSHDRLTTIGAQKDDYKFIFGGSEAKSVASRGENRTIIFALLSIIAKLARQQYGDRVVVLLDDIDSELDYSHRINLYDLPSFQSHTIATTLDYRGDHHSIRLG